MRFLDLPPLFDLPHLAPSEIAESGAEVLAWLTGEPLYIIGLIAFAFVVRWLLHRLVDRVVRRAETGVLPARVWRDGSDPLHRFSITVAHITALLVVALVSNLVARREQRRRSNPAPSL